MIWKAYYLFHIYFLLFYFICFSFKLIKTTSVRLKWLLRAPPRWPWRSMRPWGLQRGSTPLPRSLEILFGSEKHLKKTFEIKDFKEILKTLKWNRNGISSFLDFLKTFHLKGLEIYSAWCAGTRAPSAHGSPRRLLANSFSKGALKKQP